MSDAPPWLADAVEAAADVLQDEVGEVGLWLPIEHVRKILARVNGVFMRAMPDRMLVYRHQGEDEHGIVIGDDGLTTHTLAAAIERLGAPEKPDAP